MVRSRRAATAFGRSGGRSWGTLVGGDGPFREDPHLACKSAERSRQWRHHTVRRAQVTIFFAIGLVLIIVLLLVVYVVSLGPGRPQSVDVKPLQQYLQGCVDSSFFDALDTLGKNGGAFLDGSDMNASGAFSPLELTIGNSRVAQSVKPTPVSLLPAKYDIDGADTAPYATYESNAFGLITMPRLCDPVGPNGRDKLGDVQCPPFAYPGNLYPEAAIIQRSLAYHLKQSVRTCLGTNGVEARVGINPQGLGAPVAEVFFAPENVRVTIAFPDSAIAGVTKKTLLERSYKVRLYLLYLHALERLVMNTRYPVYKITKSDVRPPFFPRLSGSFSITSADVGNVHTYTFKDPDPAFSYSGRKLEFTVYVQDREAYNNVDPDE